MTSIRFLRRSAETPAATTSHPSPRPHRAWSRCLRAMRLGGIVAATWLTAAADEARPPGNELLLLGGGADLRQSAKSSFGALQVRFNPDVAGIRPYATVGWASGGTFYSGAGLYYRFALPRRLQLTIGSGPGYYHHHGPTTNLGYALEFNSWIELSGIVFGRRVGISAGHISNAHLGRVNPGSETVGLSVSALRW